MQNTNEIKFYFVRSTVTGKYINEDYTPFLLVDFYKAKLFKQERTARISFNRVLSEFKRYVDEHGSKQAVLASMQDEIDNLKSEILERQAELAEEAKNGSQPLKFQLEYIKDLENDIAVLEGEIAMVDTHFDLANFGLELVTKILEG